MVGHTNGANTSHPLYFVSQHERYIFGYYVRAFFNSMPGKSNRTNLDFVFIDNISKIT